MHSKQGKWSRVGIGLSIVAFLAAPQGFWVARAEEAGDSEAEVRHRFDEIRSLSQRRPQSREERTELLENRPKRGEAFLSDFPEAEQSSQVRFLICQWYAEKKDFEKTSKAAETFLELHPDHDQVETVRLIQGMALLQMDEERGVDLMESLTKKEEIPGIRWQAFYLLGEYWMEKREFDRGREYFRAALEAAPDTRAVRNLDGTGLRLLQHMEKIGKPPKPFHATGTEGEEISLDTFRGKVVLVDVWATWCGPCVREIPEIRSIYETHRKDGFEVLGISLDDDPQWLKKFMKKKNMNWPQLCVGKKAERHEIRQSFPWGMIPQTYLLDREGNVRYVSLRGKKLEEAVEKLMREKTE